MATDGATVYAALLLREKALAGELTATEYEDCLDDLHSGTLTGNEPRAEGDVWQGPSGRWFTIKDGRAVRAKDPNARDEPGAPKKSGGVDAVKETAAHIQDLISKGKVGPQDVEELAARLSTLSLTDLRGLKKELGVKASRSGGGDRSKDILARKIAERALGGATKPPADKAPDPKPPEAAPLHGLDEADVNKVMGHLKDGGGLASVKHLRGLLAKDAAKYGGPDELLKKLDKAGVATFVDYQPAGDKDTITVDGLSFKSVLTTQEYTKRVKAGNSPEQAVKGMLDEYEAKLQAKKAAADAQAAKDKAVIDTIANDPGLNAKADAVAKLGDHPAFEAVRVAQANYEEASNRSYEAFDRWRNASGADVKEAHENVKRVKEEIDKLYVELVAARKELDRVTPEIQAEVRRVMSIPAGRSHQIKITPAAGSADLMSTHGNTTEQSVNQAAQWFDGMWAKTTVPGAADPKPCEVLPTPVERACAQPWAGTIKLSRFQKPHVVVHELGHHLEEHTPGAKQATAAFLAHRVGNEKPQKMKDLSPGYNYGDDELGRKDKFDSVFESSQAYYVGKDYGGVATEVLSMGVQLMYQDPIRFARKDPEYFKYVAGIMDGTLRNPPAAKP